MEQRTILAITGIPILLLVSGILAYFAVISLTDLSPIILPIIVSAIMGLAIYGFKPKEKHFDKEEYEREQRGKEDVDYKLKTEKEIADMLASAGYHPRSEPDNPPPTTAQVKKSWWHCKRYRYD